MTVSPGPARSARAARLFRVTVAAAMVCISAVACQTTGGDAARAQRVRGRVVGVDSTRGARIEIYRITRGGPIVETGLTAPFTRAGGFVTPVLRPGRYSLVLRAPDRPPAAVSIRVPPGPDIRIDGGDKTVLSTLELIVPTTAGVPTGSLETCVLSREAPDSVAPDVRRVRVPAGGRAVVLGVRAGKWHVDLPRRGATTEIIVPRGERTLEATLSVPGLRAGATLRGRVIRADGEPAPGVAVSVRQIRPDGTAAAWGRVGVTDSDGEYVVQGIEGGQVLVRTESRNSVYPRLPHPVRLTIPPRSEVRRSFVVDL